MQCPSCGTENSESAKFCRSCGKKLVIEMTVKCPHCGADGQENRLHCTNCGKELAVRPSETRDRFCTACGKKIGPAADVCPFCGHRSRSPWDVSSYEEPSYGDLEESYRPETAKPVVAGVLLILAGLLAIGQGVMFLAANEIVRDYYGSAAGSNLCLCGGLGILFGLVAIGGAVSCFKREGFVFALVGALLGMLGIGFVLGGIFGLVALILIALAKEEFE